MGPVDAQKIAVPAVGALHDDPFLRRWSRRFVSFSFVGMALLVSVVAFPLALVHDAIRRRRFSGVRFWAVVIVFLGAELVGLTLAFELWLRRLLGGSEAAYLDAHYRLQWWWVSTIFEWSRRILDVHVEVEGLDAVEPGPMLLVLRHASLVDTLLPGHLVSSRLGLKLRYVLKRELVWDPCLDVVGHRIPNAFVQRGGADHDKDLSAVRALVEGLGRHEGVLLFPEGTRFSESRRRRSLEYLEANEPEIHALAEPLENVLPPRLGGLFALLDAAPNLHVVFCSHRGLDGIRTFDDLLNGTLIGRTIAVRFWRYSADTIPTAPAERTRWLYDAWADVDRFVGEAA
ncbi:MAG: 1-acyl-sn-glycerol-3-phosphate acyltransferase [Deltaproteobacteria bacterium]|jgi:1-acyl-sn-glycerol-3-phosphate acyltransferase